MPQNTFTLKFMRFYLSCLGTTELEDIKRPPRNAKGPFVISGNNRFGLLWFSCLSRFPLCRIVKNLRTNLDHFRKFYMSVYCFPDPKSAQQVPTWLSYIMSLECS